MRSLFALLLLTMAVTPAMAADGRSYFSDVYHQFSYNSSHQLVDSDNDVLFENTWGGSYALGFYPNTGYHYLDQLRVEAMLSVSEASEAFGPDTDAYILSVFLLANAYMDTPMTKNITSHVGVGVGPYIYYGRSRQEGGGFSTSDTVVSFAGHVGLDYNMNSWFGAEDTKLDLTGTYHWAPEKVSAYSAFPDSLQEVNFVTFRLGMRLSY